jgi:hypothetical protein
MDQIAFAVVVDEEIALVFGVRPESKLNTTFRLSPKIIDATNLGVMPPLGSIWNGATFDIPEDLMPLDPYTELNPEIFHVFAYVVDNVFIGRSIVRNDADGSDKVFAVYRSSPTFVDITAQAAEIGVSPFDLIGRQIIDGQIAPE